MRTTPGRHQSDFEPQLVAALEDRLKTLQHEVAAIRRALKILHAAAQPHSAAPPSPSQSLVEALRQHPNARPSVLALARGAAVETVVDELQTLERDGIVARDGPRWHAT